MLDDFIVFFLNTLGASGNMAVDQLVKSPAQYSPTLHQAAVNIHNVAVKPVTSIVLAIMFVLMLATTSTRAEGDRELGVRIIAATMFKIAMVFIVAQNAVLFLNGLSDIAVFIAGTADGVNVSGASGGTKDLGEQLRSQIEALGVTEKLTLVVILLLPTFVSLVASVLAVVLVFVRFLQMYLLSAFASLPLAFLGHEDTKGIGISYLKGFASVALTGAVLVITVKFYQAIAWRFGTFKFAGGDFLEFIFASLSSFFIAPLVLIFMLFGANSLAKKIVGEA